MKTSTFAALALVVGLSSFGAAHAAVNPNVLASKIAPNTGALSNGPGPQVTAVPEPATWAMMLVGAAAIGYSLRTRRAPRKA